jgi:hypothetical protein
MHNDWRILSWTWSAVVIMYCILALIADRRLSGGEKKLNQILLILIAGLVGVGIWTRHAFGGQMHRLAVLVAGIAAGIAALIVAKMLITQKPGDRDVDADNSDEQIQLLKLN